MDAVDDSYGDVFGVDVAGWIEQNRSREPYEVVREPIQNALDTGTDIYVRIDYSNQSVVVVDDDEDGVQDLSHFYDLFSGDKHYDPEKRGRFGRGIKEFIGASDETVISSTGGGLRFTFDAAYNNELEEYVVEASRDLYPEAKRECGTVVYGTNDDWSHDDLKSVQEFVEELWLPENQHLNLTVYDDPFAEAGVYDSVVTHVEPDAVLERQYLPTLAVEDGMQVQRNRGTSVEVKRSDPGEGGVYELGIPVTNEEEFPFVFNVQQKTPVTERRNELDNSYRSTLMEGVINERLDLFDDDELGENYVTQYISKYSHNIRPSVQREYIQRRFGTDPDDLLVYTNETPPLAIAWAVQQHIPSENADEYSRNVRGILTSRCRSVQDWYTERKEGQTIKVIDDPELEQEALIEYFDSEIKGRTRARDVDFKLAFITDESENGQTHATYSPSAQTIYLNALADAWDEPSPKRIGTVLHELGHHEGSDEGHGHDWYHAVEELSGEVIQSLQNELDKQRGTKP